MEPNQDKRKLMDVLIAGQKRQRNAAESAREAERKLADYERAERAAIAEFNEAKMKKEAATDAVNEAREEARKLKSDSDVLNLAFDDDE